MSTEKQIEKAFLKKAYESLQEIPDHDRDLFFEAFGRQFNVSAGWLELDPPRYPHSEPPSQDSEEFITADSLDDFDEYDDVPVDNLEHQTMSLERYEFCKMCKKMVPDLEEHTSMIHKGNQTKLFESELALEDNPLGDSGMWNTKDPDPNREHDGWQDMFSPPVEESPSVNSGSNDSGNFYCPKCSRPFINMSWDNIYQHGISWHGMREDKARKMADDFTSEFMRDAFAEPFPEDTRPQSTSMEADGLLPDGRSWYDVSHQQLDDGGLGDYNGALGNKSMLGGNLNQQGYSQQECPNCGARGWNPPRNDNPNDWDFNTYQCTNCGTIYNDENVPLSEDTSYTDSQGYTIKRTDPQIQRGHHSFTAGGVPDIVPDEAYDDPRSFYEGLDND